MLKRLTSIIFIVLACVIFLGVIYFLILFLAPGFMLFGVKYIMLNTHIVSTGKTSITETLGSFTEITINAHEIPIYVVFTEDYDFQYIYYENFNGLTTSTFDDPSISSDKQSGVVTFEINEFRKFVLENSGSDRYFILYIPLNSISSSSYLNLTINSESSDITFIKNDSTDERIPHFNTITINTNGKIDYQTEIVATTYNLTTNRSVVIDEDSDIISATNYSINLSFGNITIGVAVSGDLDLTTKNGNIKLISCKNLTISTVFGNISSAGDDDINVSGVVNIVTRAGSVTLGKVSGSGQNYIKTSSGSIKIDSIGSGEIETNRGSVNIRSSDNLTITTSTGKVRVEISTTKLQVTTKRGNVELGSTGVLMNNATVTTNLGKVTMYSASGTTYIKTLSSDVIFYNYDSTDITIECGDDLTATGLTGNVNISAEGDVSLGFANLNGKVVVNLGEKSKTATVEVLNNTIDSVGYILSGSSVSIYQQNRNGSFSQLQPSYESNITFSALLTINGANASISIYFAYAG